VRFAKIVFWTAAVWGVLVLTPLCFMFGTISRMDPPAITHPGFYYGFVALGLAWQFAFCVIATDPLRYRPLMLPSLVEKFGYGIAGGVLVLQNRMSGRDLVFAGADLLLGLLFAIAFLRTRRQGASIERE
jgi:hypothetical protein